MIQGIKEPGWRKHPRAIELKATMPPSGPCAGGRR